MRDYLGLDEFLTWLFEGFVEPYITDPICEHIDDMMYNIVGVTGNKQFNTQWQQYLTRDKERRELRAKLRKERDSVNDETKSPNKPVKQGDHYEMSGTVPFTNLNRVVAQLDDVIHNLTKDVEEETEVSQESFLKSLKDQEIKTNKAVYPDRDSFELRDHLKTDQPIENDSKDKAIKDPSQYTVWGDKKISPANVKTEDDYTKQKQQNIRTMFEEGSEFVWTSPEEFGAHLILEKVKEEWGVESLDELIELQDRMRIQDETFMQQMIKDRMNEINLMRQVNDLPPITMEQTPKPSEEEFDIWKRRFLEERNG